MSWEKEEQEKGWTRREWVKLGFTASAVASIAGMGGLVAGQILPPPYKFTGEIRETIQYTKFPRTDPTADLWWNPKAGTTAKVSDFQEWQGATGVWRGLYQDGRFVPGTGFPVLVIRIRRESQFFTAPLPEELPAALPEGFSLYFDNKDVDAANGGTRIVVLYDRCVHLCCTPGYHVVTSPEPDRGYIASPFIYDEFRQDPVYCLCHGSQYDPMQLVINTHPRSGAKYVGALRVHGPAERAMPVIPVRDQGPNLVGYMADPAWYIYC